MGGRVSVQARKRGGRLQLQHSTGGRDSSNATTSYYHSYAGTLTKMIAKEKQTKCSNAGEGTMVISCFL